MSADAVDCLSGSEAIELPSDVDSEIELPPDAPPEPLRGSASTSKLDPDRCCTENCLRHLQDSPALSRRVTELGQALNAYTKCQRKTLQFKRLKEWGIGLSTWRRYCAWGLTLCATAVGKLLHISQYHLRQFNAEIAQGHDMPQCMLTETQQQRNKRGAWTKADAILQWLHDQVAEDLAESVREKMTRYLPAPGPAGCRRNQDLLSRTNCATAVSDGCLQELHWQKC